MSCVDESACIGNGLLMCAAAEEAADLTQMRNDKAIKESEENTVTVTQARDGTLGNGREDLKGTQRNPKEEPDFAGPSPDLDIRDLSEGIRRHSRILDDVSFHYSVTLRTPTTQRKTVP